MFLHDEIIGRVVDRKPGALRRNQPHEMSKAEDRRTELTEEALVGNDLRRVAVVGRDQDQRVRIFIGEGQCALQGFVELLEFADGSAGVPSMGLLVDGRGLDHQEEAIGILVAELE